LWRFFYLSLFHNSFLEIRVRLPVLFDFRDVLTLAAVLRRYFGLGADITHGGDVWVLGTSLFLNLEMDFCLGS